MRRWLALLSTVLALLAVPAVTVRAAETPVCRQSLPAATDGRLQLDRAALRPGERTVGVLTGFRVWPAALVGGGSGETFLSCAPWLPDARAEVMPAQAMALFVVTVPVGTAPGRYAVSVLFREGSRLPLGDDGRLVRLSTTLTVTPQPVPAPGTSPACSLSLPAAPVGTLDGPRTAIPGSTVRFAVRGVPDSRRQVVEEYDRLWLLGCLAGRATLGIGSPGPLDLAVPAWASSGRYLVRVSGLVDGRAVTWQRSLQVSGATPSTAPTSAAPVVPAVTSAPATPPSGSPAPTTSAPTPAPTTPAPTPVPSPTLQPQRTADESGSAVPWLLGALTLTALLTGGWFAYQRRV